MRHHLSYNGTERLIKNLNLPAIVQKRQHRNMSNNVSSTSYKGHQYDSVCSGTIDKSLSDHYLVYSIFDIKKCKVVPLHIRCRNFNKFDHDSFLCDLVKSETLKSIYSATDVNTAFKTEYLKICQIFAPIRKILVKDR